MNSLLAQPARKSIQMYVGYGYYMKRHMKSKMHLKHCQIEGNLVIISCIDRAIEECVLTHSTYNSTWEVKK